MVAILNFLELPDHRVDLPVQQRQLQVQSMRDYLKLSLVNLELRVEERKNAPPYDYVVNARLRRKQHELEQENIRRLEAVLRRQQHVHALVELEVLVIVHAVELRVQRVLAFEVDLDLLRPWLAARVRTFRHRHVVLLTRYL